MQGFRLAQNIKLTFERERVLAKLRSNRTRHIKILAEAKEGYLKAAHAALEAKLKEIEAGKEVDLNFSLTRPVSHMKTYEAMISMLEAASDEKLELTTEQQQAFMCDEWDWQQDFLALNASYSAIARGLR